MDRLARRRERLMYAPRAVRNWAAILIFIDGVGALLSLVPYLVKAPRSVHFVTDLVQLIFEYFPGVLLVAIAMVTFALGTKRLGSVAGANRVGRAAFLVLAILGAVSQLAYMNYLVGDPSTYAHSETIQAVAAIGAVVVGLVAAVFVYRGGVVIGFGRIALFLAVALFAATEVLILTADVAISEFWDAPRLAGIVVLGIGYWRAGTGENAPHSAS